MMAQPSAVDGGELRHTEGGSSCDPSSAVSNSVLLDELKKIQRGQDDFRSHVSDQLNALRSEIISTVDQKINTFKISFESDIKKMQESVANVQNRLTLLENLGASTSHADVTCESSVDDGGKDNLFDPVRSVVIFGLASAASFGSVESIDQLQKMVKDLFVQGLSLEGMVVEAVKRMPSRGEKIGIIKCRLRDKESKVSVLRAKKVLKDSDVYRRVFIKGAQSHVEHLIDYNTRTLLRGIPGGDRYRIAGNGKIVLKHLPESSRANDWDLDWNQGWPRQQEELLAQQAQYQHNLGRGRGRSRSRGRGRRHYP